MKQITRTWNKGAKMILDFLWKNFFTKKKDKNIIDVLSVNPIFESLKYKELKFMAQIMHQRAFVPGEFIFQSGKGLGMYIILSGKVQILYSDNENGEAVILSQLEEGDFFGELALAQENGYHYVSAQAVSECKLLGFFRPDLLTLVQKNPITGVKILMKLSSILGERLQKSGEKLFKMNAQTDS